MSVQQTCQQVAEGADCGAAAEVRYYGKWLCEAHLPDSLEQDYDWRQYVSLSANACLTADLTPAALAAGVVGLAVELATCQQWDNNGYCWYCGRQNYAGQGEHTEDCIPAKVRALLGDAPAAGGG